MNKLNIKERKKSINCKICRVKFECKSGPSGSCWCLTSPNLLKSWDLDGECVCPNCLAAGQREEMLKKRTDYLKARKLSSPRYINK